jgi:hypothetical protein
MCKIGLSEVVLGQLAFLGVHYMDTNMIFAVPWSCPYNEFSGELHNEYLFVAS